MEPIAVIGMACRFPKADSLSSFWHMLATGKHGIRDVPETRWDANKLYDPDPKAEGKTNSRHGGFIDDIELFDASFFGIAPREAIQMDPQQRILMELSYEAFEDAGVSTSSLAGSDTGVFIGVMSNDYLKLQTADSYRHIDVHTGSGAGFCMLANRLSYQFDLSGPSMAIDSACSSSLVGIFQACQALWSRQSSLALAGGVNLMLDPAFNIFYAKAGLLAPDGRCKTFSANADGIGRGEGAGVVILKRQNEAMRDGDQIYAVIHGGSINHDGRSNGVTAPNRWAQEKLLRNAWRHAGVRGSELQYIELHGTGTYIGDPIEANALGSVFNEENRQEPCIVGSVKSNIGHLEGAAGVAGFIKLALSIHKRELPPSLWFDTPNPVIDFANVPLEVNTELKRWPEASNAGSLFAGISSFGLGGTNAHLVLGAAPEMKENIEDISDPKEFFLLLSGRSEERLRDRVEQFIELLKNEVDLIGVCMTSLRRRNVYEHRLCVFGYDRHTMRQALVDYLDGKSTPHILSERYKNKRKTVQVLVPHAVEVSPIRLACWLMSAPHGKAAWQQCRNVLLELGDQRLPELSQLAETSLPSDDSSRKLLFFVAQYSLLQQLLAVLPASQLSLIADGMGQLSACCAAGALTVTEALEWLKAGINTPAPATAHYRHICECASGINPQLSDIQWNVMHDNLPNKFSEDDVAVVVLNIDGASFPSGVMQCIGERENDYSYLFGRLALKLQLHWSGLADKRFVRLPKNVWHREYYWLHEPVTSDAIASISSDSSKKVEAETVAEEKDSATYSLRSSLMAMLSDERKQKIIIYLQERVAEALRLQKNAVVADQPLNTMGIDSLTAVEVKNRIESDLGVTLQVVSFLNGFSVEDFARQIVDDLCSDTPATTPHTTALPHSTGRSESGTPDIIHQQVAEMSPEQVDELLNQLMQHTV